MGDSLYRPQSKRQNLWLICREGRFHGAWLPLSPRTRRKGVPLNGPKLLGRARPIGGNCFSHIHRIRGVTLMTTSPILSFISELESSEPLSEGTLAYFRERQRNRIHDLVLGEFLKSGISKAAFARRIGREPSQITRWLAAPGNWELDTISDFLLAISGAEFRPSLSYPAHEIAQDHSGPDWLSSSEPGRIKQERLSLEELLIPRGAKRAIEVADRGDFDQPTRNAALDIASKQVQPRASDDNVSYDQSKYSALRQVAAL